MLAATLTTLTPRMRFNFSKPNIENIVFKMHYKATVTLLLAFVILVCAREYFGEHIKCISDQGVPDHVIQTYCFFMATFTIVSFETLLPISESFNGLLTSIKGIGRSNTLILKFHVFKYLEINSLIKSVCKIMRVSLGKVSSLSSTSREVMEEWTLVIYNFKLS